MNLEYEGMKFDIKVNADHPIVEIHYLKESKTLVIQGFYQKKIAELGRLKEHHVKTIEL